MTDKEKAIEISQRYLNLSSRRTVQLNFRQGCAYKRGQFLAYLEERKKGWEYSLNYGGDFAKGALKAVNEILEWANRDERDNPCSIIKDKQNIIPQS